MRSTLLSLALIGMGAAAFAQEAAAHPVPNDRGTAKATVAGKSITIDYGRPSLQGREPLKMAAVGQPWRMGKDDATTLTTGADLAFGDAKVPKGSYVLTATKLADDKWTLNVSDKSKNKIAEIPLTVGVADPAAELFTINLKGDKNAGEFEMMWGSVSLKSPFTAK